MPEAVLEALAEPLGIDYVQGDLSEPFAGAFDAVIANMVFQDIPDYREAVRNCVAALRPGGSLIFSLVHPCFEESAAEWAAKGYVAVREYLQEHTRLWRAGGPPHFHRPLSAYLNLVIESGCVIRRVVEPGLATDPRNAHVPSFIVVHASRCDGAGPEAPNRGRG